MKGKVEEFFDQLNHPLQAECIELRSIIVNHFPELNEIIKWNAASYQVINDDFLTFNCSKSNEIRLIFHRGATVKAQPKEHLIEDHSNVLKWATNDRAIATFRTLEDIKRNEVNLITIISNWMKVLQE